MIHGFFDSVALGVRAWSHAAILEVAWVAKIDSAIGLEVQYQILPLGNWSGPASTSDRCQLWLMGPTHQVLSSLRWEEIIVETPGALPDQRLLLLEAHFQQHQLLLEYAQQDPMNDLELAMTLAHTVHVMVIG